MGQKAGVHMPEVGSMTTSDEWQRFLQAQNGDQNSWRALVEIYRPRLTTLALLITGSVATAEDIVQETFVRAANSDLKHTNGTVSGYLGTITYRLAVKEARRNNRSTELDQTEPADHNGRTPLDHILRNEQERQVAAAIRNLDQQHREVLVLRFYSEHSYTEIAALLDIPLGTVKSRMFNAVKSCRELLRTKGILE